MGCLEGALCLLAMLIIMGPDVTTRRGDRKVLLRIPKRHEIRGPASLLVGTEAEFNQVGLFSTHKCAPALRAHAAQTGAVHLVA